MIKYDRLSLALDNSPFLSRLTNSTSEILLPLSLRDSSLLNGVDLGPMVGLSMLTQSDGLF